MARLNDIILQIQKCIQINISNGLTGIKQLKLHKEFPVYTTLPVCNGCFMHIIF